MSRAKLVASKTPDLESIEEFFAESDVAIWTSFLHDLDVFSLSTSCVGAGLVSP